MLTALARAARTATGTSPGRLLLSGNLTVIGALVRTLSPEAI
jgi:hypothetical protein